MALPAPRTHWRLSEIAEELENLDLSLDMDFSKDMDDFLKGSSLNKDSSTIYSSTDVAGPKDKSRVTSCDSSAGYVDFTKDVIQKEEKKKSHYSKCRSRGPVMPKVPPPPPPTQTPPSSCSDSEPKFPVPQTPPPQTPPSGYTPPVPESPAPLPPPFLSQSSHSGVSVLPPLPQQAQRSAPMTIPNSSADDLPPPPPIFDLPEPVFSPPSPCTSPGVLTHEPSFRRNYMAPPSPLTLSDTTSGYTSSGTSDIATSIVSETTSTVYAPTSVASSTSDHPSELSDEVEPVFEKITEEDIQQVEMFYRSHKAHVYVCPGIANLYMGNASVNSNGDKWELSQTGIPVLLMDSGEARRDRKLQIILAEKGSGFILWKDYIDQLSNFKSLHSNFQTMYLSNDHTRLAGFSYDDENAASDFLSTLQEFTSDPNDDALRMGRSKKKKKVKKQKYKAPKKTDISQPCGFVHVTKLDRNDHEQYVNHVGTPILTTRNPNNMS